MSMNDFEKYISDYFDGELSSDNVKKFEELLNNNMEFKKKFKDSDVPRPKYWVGVDSRGFLFAGGLAAGRSQIAGLISI